MKNSELRSQKKRNSIVIANSLVNIIVSVFGGGEGGRRDRKTCGGKQVREKGSHGDEEKRNSC